MSLSLDSFVFLFFFYSLVPRVGSANCGVDSKGREIHIMRGIARLISFVA